MAGAPEALGKGSALPTGTVVMESSYRNPLLGELRHRPTTHCSITYFKHTSISDLWSKLRVTAGAPTPSPLHMFLTERIHRVLLGSHHRPQTSRRLHVLRLLWGASSNIEIHRELRWSPQVLPEC